MPDDKVTADPKPPAKKKAAPKKAAAKRSAPRRSKKPAPTTVNGPDFEASETPAAALAFEQYYALGEQRGLRKLAEQRVAGFEAERAAQGAEPLSTVDRNRKYEAEFKSVGRWSAGHHWQHRVKERDWQAFESRRREVHADLTRIRDDLIIGVRVDVGRYLNQLAKEATDPNAAPIMITDAKSLRTVLDMLTELSGVELADIGRHRPPPPDGETDEDGAGGAPAAGSAESALRGLERLLRRATE